MLLALAAVVRLAFAIACRPALFFSDSWLYVALAWDSALVGFAPDRPSGYSVFLKLVGGPGHSLAAITTVQHLLGLVAGALLYALLLRLQAPRWLALGASAIVLFDGYAITLEQTPLPEVAVALLLLTATFLVIETARAPRRALWLVGAAGVLLAVAATMRTAAIFAVPVWLIYVWMARSSWRAPATALAAVVVPLVMYSAAHLAAGGSFGKTTRAGGSSTAGWVRSRTAAAWTFRPARACCAIGRRLTARRGRSSTCGARSRRPTAPSKGVLSGDEAEDALLRDFAFAVIRERPGEYAGGVLGRLRPLLRSRRGLPRHFRRRDHPARAAPRYAALHEDRRVRRAPARLHARGAFA